MRFSGNEFDSRNIDDYNKKKLYYREDVLINLIKKDRKQDAIEKLNGYMAEDSNYIPYKILKVILSNENEVSDNLLILKKDIGYSTDKISIHTEINKMLHRKINQYIEETIKRKINEINAMFSDVNIITGKLNQNEYMKYPIIKKHTNNSGNALFGIEHDNIVNAILKYMAAIEKMDIDIGNEIIDEMKTTIYIEKLANIYIKAFKKYKACYYNRNESVSIEDIILELYSDFLKESKEIIKKRLETSGDFYKNKWKEIVPNEDDVNEKQLGEFYNALPFPIGAFSPLNLTNLNLAYYALPIIFINSSQNIKKVFDYGGNTGDTLVAINESCDVEECMLVEENQNFIDYAKFRDSKVQRHGMIYKKESELILNIEQYIGFYDFGICTEVLEHVFDVEKTVETLSKLLKKGGVLYVTASFGLYPEASHLKKNVKYAGKEDELMAKYNLQRINISDSPIPLLSNMCFYQKI